MNDPELRGIFDSLRELRNIKPPPIDGMRVVESARRQLLARQRRRMVRTLFLTCTAAAAVIGIGMLISHQPQRDTLSNPPIVQLQDAVRKTSDYQGVVQIRYESVQLDPEGQPTAPPAVGEREINTMDRRARLSAIQREAMMRAVAEMQGHKQDENVALPELPMVEANSTILIPLTWGAQTILVPHTFPTSRPEPYAVTPDQTVVLEREAGYRQFQIAPKANGSEQATVWVGNRSGMVEKVQLKSTEELNRWIVNYRYQFLNPPATNPARTIRPPEAN